jgi:hypothetical protein
MKAQFKQVIKPARFEIQVMIKHYKEKIKTLKQAA